jgi:hypothetical protein
LVFSPPLHAASRLFCQTRDTVRDHPFLVVFSATQGFSVKHGSRSSFFVVVFFFLGHFKGFLVEDGSQSSMEALCSLGPGAIMYGEKVSLLSEKMPPPKPAAIQ